MNQADSVVTQNTGTLCPECGSDVRILRDTKRHWAHGSRLAATILWLICVLGISGYWLFISYTGIIQSDVDLRHSLGSEYRFALTPWSESTDLDTGYLSTQELYRAVEHDPVAMGRVRDALLLSAPVDDSAQGVSGLLGVRFGLIETTAFATQETDYRFGGSWVTISKSVGLDDARDQDSFFQDWSLDWEFDWERVEWKFFPVLEYHRTISNTQSGRNNETRIQLNYLTILSVLCVCIAVVRGVGWAIGKAGWKLLKSRGTRVVACAIVFTIGGLVACLLPDQRTFSHSTTSYEKASSLEYPIDELHEVISSEEGLAQWAREMLGLIPEDQSGDLLVGQYRLFDQDADPSTHTADIRYFDVSIGTDFQPFIWAHAEFGDGVPDADLQELTRLISLKPLLSDGVIPIAWKVSRSFNIIWIGVVHSALVLMSSYWIWRLFQWIGRLVLLRIQKKRTRKDQCTFCGYPLTPEGRKTRSAHESP